MPPAAVLLALALVALQASPPARGWDDFPVFVWRERHAGKPLPEELSAPFGGVILMREEDSGWARERGLSYLVWNVAGRDALHLDADEAWNERVEKWIATRDEKLLVREPCLNDPATLARLHATLDATLARHGAHPGLGFVLGDEVSLTPNGDPFDLCRCERCESKWREHARAHGLPERAPLTDEVRQRLVEDDFSLLGPWLARRRFDQDQLVRLLEELAPRCGMSPSWTGPGPYLGLLGCSGQTAFGGVALERLTDRIGLVECYPVGDSRELVATHPWLERHSLEHSTGPVDQARALTTLFVREETAAGLAWQVFDAWIRGCAGMVLWNDADLEALPSASRARLSEAVAAVRGMEWHFPDDPSPTRLRMGRRPRTVAIVRDADSTAASFLRDALLDGPTWPRRKAAYQRLHGRLERKVETWLRLLEDCGFRPGSLPLASVCARCTSQFDVLVLPELLVVDEDDVERLRAYVEAGGTLVIDGTLGWVDREGAAWNRAVRERLREKHPERVVDAPDGVLRYLVERLDVERRLAARRFVLELPAVQRWRRSIGQGLPSFTGDAAELAWYVAQFDPSETRTGLALLPNCATAAERAKLRDVDLRGIRAPEGSTIEWIHPRGGDVLRAGDAAVFLLTAQEPR